MAKNPSSCTGQSPFMACSALPGARLVLLEICSDMILSEHLPDMMFQLRQTCATLLHIKQFALASKHCTTVVSTLQHILLSFDNLIVCEMYSRRGFSIIMIIAASGITALCRL